MKTNALEHTFADLVNGNLSEAKRRAKRVSRERLTVYALENLAWSWEHAYAATGYLKGFGTFQEYCDAEHAYKSRNDDGRWV